MSDSEGEEEIYCEDEYLKSVQDTVDHLKNIPNFDILRYISLIDLMNTVKEYMNDINRKDKYYVKDLTEEELCQYSYLIKVIMDNLSYTVRENDIYHIKNEIYTRLVKF